MSSDHHNGCIIVKINIFYNFIYCYYCTKMIYVGTLNIILLIRVECNKSV